MLDILLTRTAICCIMYNAYNVQCAHLVRSGSHTNCLHQQEEAESVSALSGACSFLNDSMISNPEEPMDCEGVKMDTVSPPEEKNLICLRITTKNRWYFLMHQVCKTWGYFRWGGNVTEGLITQHLRKAFHKGNF